MDSGFLGEKIKYFRHRAGLTQEELGNAIGVTWEMVSRYERGLSSPLSRIEGISKALNVTLNELLQESNNPNDSEVNETGYKAVRIPFFTTLPTGGSFEARRAGYLYSAPDWIFQLDREVFAVDASIVTINVANVQQKGPIYVSPNLPPENGSLCLVHIEDKLVISQYASNIQGRIVGVVLAQEFRFN